MRSTLFLGMFVAGLGALSLATAACGGGTGGEGGSGGEGTGGSSTTSTTSTTSSTTNSTSTNSTSTSGSTVTTSSTSSNNGCAGTFATAQDIVVGDQNPTACQLNNPSADSGFFKFSGNKGDAMIIYTTSKTGTDPFDTTYLDTVVTLYDAQMNQIAQNDDPTPRFTNDAEIWTILPATGDYVIQVQECNGAYPQGCADPAEITTFDYEVGVIQTGPGAPIITTEDPPNDAPNDASDPTALTGVNYEPSDTSYYLSTIYGAFNTATDVDVYSFTMPIDVAVNPEGRALGNFFGLPAHDTGNGSTGAIGKIWIVDPADVTHKVAEVDLTKGTVPADVGAPLTLGQEYYLFVSKEAGAAGANDFYFMRHYGGGSNPIELDDAGNNVAATAEALSDAGEAGFLASYFVDGNLTPAATDVDYYALAVPSGAATISVACGAQRSGSGLRGMKFEVRTPANVLVGTTQTDVADDDVFLDKAAVPGGATVLHLKVYGATQDALVTSDFYRCGVRFQDATP